MQKFTNKLGVKVISMAVTFQFQILYIQQHMLANYFFKKTGVDSIIRSTRDIGSGELKPFPWSISSSVEQVRYS